MKWIEMDNHVSKSYFRFEYEKEQRVNGNLVGNNIPSLIYTLVHFERNTQLKIHIKLINKYTLNFIKNIYYLTNYHINNLSKK